MNKNISYALIVVAVVLGWGITAARAQNPTQNPVTTAILRAVTEHGNDLVAGAKEMPASKYNYKPTPAQMTFGRMVLHVAQANGFLCSRVSGETAPSTQGLMPESPKPKLVAAMQDSLTFCEQVLGKVNDSQLGEQVAFFGGRKVTKAAALLDLATDLYDHYSQEAIYLRINGLLPPTAQHHRGM